MEDVTKKLMRGGLCTFGFCGADTRPCPKCVENVISLEVQSFHHCFVLCSVRWGGRDLVLPVDYSFIEKAQNREIEKTRQNLGKLAFTQTPPPSPLTPPVRLPSSTCPNSCEETLSAKRGCVGSEERVLEFSSI